MVAGPGETERRQERDFAEQRSEPRNQEREKPIAIFPRRARHAPAHFARRQAEHYAGVALQHLSAFPASPEKDALLALPEYVLSRDR